MSPQAIATLVLKVAALYCIIESIHLLLFLPLSLLSCTMLIALAALLFFKARQLVPLLIEPEGSTEGETISSSNLQAIIFAGVGLLILGLSVSRLGLGVINMVRMRLTQSGFGGWENLSVSLGALVQFGIGLALFLRARGLALFWHRLRTPGLPPAK